jgi:hypothetical protein
MSEETFKSNQLFRSIWHRLRKQIVQTVPEDCDICEFDCRKCQCTLGEWESCARRLNKAAGEFMPPHEKTSPQSD